jgi:hypothetical protein
MPERAMKLLPVSIQEHELVERQSEELIATKISSILIELPGEGRISVECNADPSAIRAVLESLRA